MLRTFCAVTVLVAFVSVNLLAGEKGPPLAPSTFKEVKVAAGFEATLFAAPPDVSYPVALCAAPTGEVFVAVDLNGSLDRKPDRGWIVRCIDTDGDGKADKFNKFVEKVESPRGLFWDNGTLWVLHPPFLRKYEDKNGDGVADNQEGEVLVKGIGFGLDFRGADHTTNGIMMGIDGWIYIAVGDYGFIKATDKSGKDLQMLGGGIARVRPDGTELEIVSRGQRNIYDVAIDPYMNLFTRDNTNDGGGWEVRLSHVPLGAQMGYPSLFKSFSDELVQPLAIYGGGSPCGSIFIDESILPAPWNNMLYTVEWGQNCIMAHPLEASGATFKPEQQRIIDLSRPTDMDIDGSGRIFIASWKNGGFNFGKPDVGFVTRVVAKDAKANPFPDLTKASDDDVLKNLSSGSHVLRLYSSREILRRGEKPALVSGLEKIAGTEGNLQGRVAAIYTLKQLLGTKSNDALAKLAGDAKVREFALKALADRISQNSGVPAKPFIDALADKDARVRVQAVTGLGRLNKPENGDAVVPLVADTDPIVAHLAVHALVEMKAIDAGLKALDKGSEIVQPGVARALQYMHDPKVVDGVIAQFEKTTTNPVQKRLLFKTLCRLHFTESPYEGKWWGTRPDTTGPYYYHKPWEQSEKISAVLKKGLATSEPEVQRDLLLELRKHKVDLPEAMPMMLKLASEDAAFRATVIELMVSRGNVPDEALPLLETVALSDKDDGAMRAKAFQGLQKSANPKALDAAVRTVIAINKDPKPHGDLNKVRNDYLIDNKHLGNLGGWTKLTDDADAAKSEIAYTVLLNLDNNKLTKPEQKKQIGGIIEAAWAKPNVASLVRAVGNTKSQEFAAKVQSLSADTRAGVADAVKYAGTKIKLDPKTVAAAKPTIAGMKYEDVLAAVMKEKGDAKRGAEVLTKAACVSCHTTSPKEPVKGPYLGDIAGRYNRAELAESILKPNAKIAQGFTTHFFITKEKKRYDGFVTKEGAEEIELRNATGEAITIKTADINKRGKLEEMSIMPEGLADGMTIDDLASLLSFLGTLTGHAGTEK